jgi:hypothetical protein
MSGERRAAPAVDRDGTGGVLWGNQALDELAGAWDHLDGSPPTPALFLTPGYQGALRRLEAGSTRFGAAVLRRENRVQAVMPLMSVLRRIGPSLSTQFLIHPGDGPLVRDAGRFAWLPVRQISPVIRLRGFDGRGGYLASADLPAPDGIRRLVGTLARTRGWDIGLFPVAMCDLPLWSDAARDAGLGIVSNQFGRRFHMLTDAQPADVLLARASANVRKAVRQAGRRAEAAGLAVTIETGDAAARTALPVLDEAARTSWKASDNNPDVPLFVPWDAALRGFVADVLSMADSRLEPVLVTARTPDGATATHLWLRRDRKLMALVTYFDPSLHALSPGRLMLLATLDWANRVGIREIDYNATSDWVAPFSDLVEPFALLTLTSRSLWGRCLRRLPSLLHPVLARAS